MIRDLGIGAADICVFAGYDHNPPDVVAADPVRAAETVGARVSAHDLEISDVFSILATSFEDRAVNHPDAAVRAESLRLFEALVEFARRLDAPGVTILPGTTFEGVDGDASLALAAAELERRAAIAGVAGLRLSIEPHFDSVVPHTRADPRAARAGGRRPDHARPQPLRLPGHPAVRRLPAVPMDEPRAAAPGARA